MSLAPFSLYIHFPYCAKRCPYCDFNVHVRKQIPEKDFVSAVLKEAQYRSSLPEWQTRNISTVFFGGGTPSLFSSEAVSELIIKLREIWKFEEDIEISMEANPDNISSQNLLTLKSAGVNRLSLGVQSLSDKFLKSLGRNHCAEQAKQAVQIAKDAGFDNINIDLMFGLPDQTVEDLRYDIATALELNTQHISYYSLTIEAGTPFYEKHLNGSLKTPSNDLSAEFMEEIIASLISKGFLHYEISNFAKSGFSCRHNQAYWQARDYLGLGPGAHSAVSNFDGLIKIRTKRWSNQTMPERYLEKPQNCLAWSEDVSGSSLAFETILLGLRQTEGIEIDTLSGLLNNVQQNALMNTINELRTEQFLVLGGNQKKIALSGKGLMLADSITERFAKILVELK